MFIDHHPAIIQPDVKPSSSQSLSDHHLLIPEDGQQLTLDDEDTALNNKSRNSIHVVFETIDAPKQLPSRMPDSWMESQ